MNRVTPWLIAPLVGISALVWLAWGPLLVTSPEEALSRAKEHRTTEGRTFAEVASAYEKAAGKRGEWKVSSFDFRLELWVKNLTGEVSGGG